MSSHHELPPDVDRSDVLRLIDRLNGDPAVAHPLSAATAEHLDPDEVTNRIASAKDVDGLTSITRPARTCIAGCAHARPRA